MGKQGLGKNISINGSFQEGTWENDKLSGLNCRMYDSETGDMYSGEVVENKKHGKGRMLDVGRDDVYEGEFESDKR